MIGEETERKSDARDLKSMSLAELRETMVSMGEPAFRGKQAFSWLRRGAQSFDEMSDLPQALRDKLQERYPLSVPKAIRRQVSALDGTIKYLWQLPDGNCVESVFMRYRHGNTVCVSSQAGCRMGCAFCASTVSGRARNLTAGEILDQVLLTERDAGEKVSNIVLMGIGEPLDNFDAVIRFLELINAPEGPGIGMRHISLSTCGVVPGIRRLGEMKLQLTLSVSLHAPDDETRSRLMPVNRKWGVDELLQTCRAYFEQTGRRISFEYAMIDGVNDRDWQADLLSEKLRGTPAHINLIPLNHVAERALKPSRRTRAFQERLEGRGMAVTVRRRLGSDIDASCGQLRRRTMEEERRDDAATADSRVRTDAGAMEEKE